MEYGATQVFPLQEPIMSQTIRVLLVDDNEPYRKAFRRNLALHDIDVIEAENADEALARIQDGKPDILVSDLQMRTRTEGLDLVREARSVAPLMPIIMISAVGTFEEGAEASRLGAMHVIAKSKIEDELEPFYSMIHRANAERLRNTALLAELDTLRQPGGGAGEALERIRAILAMPDAADYVKGEAYEALLSLSQEQMQATAPAADESALAEVDRILAEELPCYGELAPESRESLRTAEHLYRRERAMGGAIDFSRNIGFSYCFAAENEAKAAVNKKVYRMLLDKRLYEIIDQLLEGPTRHLGIFFHQALLNIERRSPMAFTIDNVRQVFLRILEHEEKYKPDGLKALAILILCFGRTYEVRTARSSLAIRNLLNLKGLNDDEAAIALAQQLARLQHYRNPYIHPEISDRGAIPAIREETLACLKVIKRIL